MKVRDFESHHDAAEALPLVTESAVVTDLEAMDRNRTEETIQAIGACLAQYGTDAFHDQAPSDDEVLRRWIRDQLDPVDHVSESGPLDEFLSESAKHSKIGDRLRKLQSRYLRPFPALVRLQVTAAEPVEFEPGQYLSIRFEDVTRPYSIASPVSANELEFCIRRVPGGELTPDLVDAVEPGTELTLRGPYGELLLQPPSPRDVVFLATGTGVAPFRPMIDYLFDADRDVIDGVERDIWLFLGVGWEDDLPYRDYFERLATTETNFHFVPTLSRERLLSDWDGETDYVQYALAKHLDPEAVDADLDPRFETAVSSDPVSSVESRLDPARMDVYACGVTAMVNSLVDAVEQLGVPSERTEFEAFG